MCDVNCHLRGLFFSPAKLLRLLMFPLTRLVVLRWRLDPSRMLLREKRAQLVSRSIGIGRVERRGQINTVIMHENVICLHRDQSVDDLSWSDSGSSHTWSIRRVGKRRSQTDEYRDELQKCKRRHDIVTPGPTKLCCFYYPIFNQ